MDKSPDAFRTISEVAEELELPQHVLRFWETRFPHIKPLKRGGGRRYYRPDDVDLLKGIRHLLYGEGYTIRGVQRILKEEGVRFVQGVGRGELSVAAAEPDEGDDARAPAEGFTDHRPAQSAPDAEAQLQPSLPPNVVRDLRSALDELLECERVLSSLKADGEPASAE